MDAVGGVRPPRICRLCLAHTTVCFSLVEDAEASGMLEALTSLRILSTDDISTIMCLKCRLNLKLAFCIQQNMLRAERRFRELQNTLPIKEEFNDEVFPEFEQIQINECLELPEKSNKMLHQMLKEVITDTYRCEICGLVKSSKRNLQIHHYNMHQTKKCPQCQKEIRLGIFKHHLQQNHGLLELEEKKTEDYSCQICGVVKTSKKLLAHHRYNVHMTKKCPQCDKEIKLGIFKHHLQKNHGLLELEEKKPEDYSCQICGVVKTSKKLLAHHRYNVHMTKKCPECDKEIKLGKYKYHLEHHHDVMMGEGRSKKFPCEICGIVKTSKRLLQHHNRNVHLTQRCPQCDKQIESEKFKQHLRQAHDVLMDENPGSYSCEICGIVKTSKKLLAHHRYNVHLTKKCPECDKDIKLGFFKQHLERNHDMLMIRDKSKGFSCPICGIVKISKALLQQHNKNVHLTKKCTQCGEEVKASRLREHMDSHNGTPSYNCDICGVSKSSKRNLSHHKYNVHMSKKCPKCNKDVKSAKFKQHVDRHNYKVIEKPKETEQIVKIKKH